MCIRARDFCYTSYYYDYDTSFSEHTYGGGGGGDLYDERWPPYTAS